MNSKLVAILVCVTLSWGMVSQTSAAPAPADQVLTLNDWIQAGSVQDQDKVYTFVGTDLAGGTQIKFQTFNFAGLDIHTVFNNQVPSGTWFLTYDIAIDPNFPGGGIRFDDISMDSDVPGASPDVLVSKAVRDGNGNLLTTLTSLSGAPSSNFSVNALNLTNLQVQLTFQVDQGVVPGPGLLLSVTDTYTQVTPVPEPASLAIWGLLAATGVAAGWRKRRIVMR